MRSTTERIKLAKKQADEIKASLIEKESEIEEKGKETFETWKKENNKRLFHEGDSVHVRVLDTVYYRLIRSGHAAGHSVIGFLFLSGNNVQHNVYVV